MVQKTLNDFNTQKVNLTGWIGIIDEDGVRHDVCVKSCLADKVQKKVIINGHNGVWVINPNQLD